MSAPCVAVAYSGGRDSTALLHATLAAAKRQGLSVVALHVHHGLSAHADAWLHHCEQQCRRWATRGASLTFSHRKLLGRPGRGESIEAWAREARYAALHEMAAEHGASLVLLAHHRLDQAETLLLQALRGAGVAGLAAMPKWVERNGLVWARPWLDVPRAAIVSYVRRHRLKHIEDDSNTDARFARNRLRLQVWPALQAAFPHAEGALADAARWAREAQLCAEELAAIDLAQVSDAQGLILAAWEALTPARRSNALRAWLKSETKAAVPATLVQRLQTELPGTSPALWSCGDCLLRRYRGRLRCQQGAVPIASQPPKETALSLRRAGRYALPGWGGCLQVQRVAHGGAPLSWLAELRLQARSGGEQFQPDPSRPARSLKKQFQTQAVPAWEREGPLLYVGEQLVFVPGLGVDARAWAPAGQPQMSFSWLAE